MAYIGNIPVPQATQTRDRFTATSNQTTFATSGYTPNFLDVYLNGVHLDASDYTATNGSDVVLDTGAATDDIVEVVAFTAFNVSEKLPDQTGNAGEYLTTDGSALSWGTITDPTPAAVSGQANTATDFFALPSGTTAQRPGSPANGYIRYNTDDDVIEEYRDGAWNDLSNVFTATGGTESTYIDGGTTYKVHTFTSSGSFTVLSGTKTVEYVVVGGGGGAGGAVRGGGAGAGGYRSSVSGESSGGGASAETAITVAPGAFTVTVGAGGTAGPYSTGNGASAGANGANSVFHTVTSLGGGGGGASDYAGAGYNPGSGGSGGGGWYINGFGNGTSGQGYDGGTSGGSQPYGGGGGGAGQAGGAFNDATRPSKGGNGVQTSITGTATYFAGGGSSGTYPGQSGVGNQDGGLGGGGASRNQFGQTSGQAPSNGTANTGGGGGASGNGGSGIVIIRYAI